jgi:hypothetical protein
MMAAIGEYRARWEGLDQLGPTLCSPVIQSKRARNQVCWADRDNWVFGLYFGHDDTRLWAPKKERGGAPSPHMRIINFSHPLGRKAFRVLLLVYLVAGTLAVMVLMALLGVRW